LFLIGLFLKKIFSSETAWPNEPKLGKKHPWKILYNDCSFSSGSLTNIQKQELLMVAMFVNGSGQNEQSCRGPSIEASYQVSLHLAEGFQRRLKCEKLTDDRRQEMAKAHIVFIKVS
jgi:hypothetical protein